MPDVGGSFGLKMNARSEELAAVLASFKLSRPVKWIQDRHENLLADDHAREDLATVTVATDQEGRILAEKAHFVESLGAYPAALSSAAILSTMIFPGPYRVPPLRSERPVRAHEPDGPRVVQRPMDVRDRCAGADDGLRGRSPRNRPSRVPPPERRSGRGPPLHDGHWCGIRSDHRGRDPRAGSRRDRLSGVAIPAAGGTGRRAPRRNRDEPVGGAHRDGLRVDEYRRRHGPHRA